MPDPTPTLLGLDIGGANVKLALLRGNTLELAQSHSFALWKTPGELSSFLVPLLRGCGSIDSIAATMTGELCDCYETKEEGVNQIVRALGEAAGNIPVRWWSTSGRMISSAQAQSQSLEVAAANWSAAATWLGRHHPDGSYLWLDVGSTTTDIIPIRQGTPTPHGKTDPQRMKSGELVYVGVKRTPLCAIMGLEGAAEFFATTDDLFGVLGLVPEYPDDRDTADNRPRTMTYRKRRLARMLCGDESTLVGGDLEELTTRLVEKIERRILDSMNQAWGGQSPPPSQVLVSGSGEWFAHRLAQKWLGTQGSVVKLSTRWGAMGSSCFPAVALAHLATPTFC